MGLRGQCRDCGVDGPDTMFTVAALEALALWAASASRAAWAGSASAASVVTARSATRRGLQPPGAARTAANSRPS